MIGLLVAALGAQGVEAQTITYADGNFGGWTRYVALTDNCLAGGSCGSTVGVQATQEGNPRPAFQITNFVLNTPGSNTFVIGAYFNGAFTYQPSISGALALVDWRVEFGAPGASTGPIGQRIALGLRQGGRVFASLNTFTPSDQTPWTPFSESQLTAQSFQALPMQGVGPSSPDFSASGAAITIGLVSTSTTISNGTGLTSVARFDNWSATLTPCDARIVTQPVDASGPSPACRGSNTEFTVGAAGIGPLTYQWQAESAPGVFIPIDREMQLPVGAVSAQGFTGPTLSIRVATRRAPTRQNLRCLVTSPCGSVTSQVAVWTVCAADINCSGQVSVQDVFDFMGRYFSGSPQADFNVSGSVSAQDIFDFLAAYFAGCS